MTRAQLAAVALLGAVAPIARAKRVLGSIPPSALERFGRSLLFLGVTGAAIGALLAFCIRKAVGDPAARSRYLAFAVVVLVCVVAGASWAATDAVNDARHNPAMFGAFGLTPLMATSILLLQPRRAEGYWLLALLYTPPFCLVMLFLLTFIQEAGFNLSW